MTARLRVANTPAGASTGAGSYQGA
ncbi:hypothetical protein SEA_OCTOBIEN14_122 [Gordonia phage Octobien14]|uniref:Uncharacterized protein n=1 Tax=Gordonia phage Octobien14 TaxID=2483673 RepID=A0A3G3MA35_9CAUD|nr:hypothetical protein L3Y22_gp122 [Gordonia phage Octobien14]AYR03285.1 hypothetical protein SEA_OCTOBIEN14_122 [Gordonia phage Octobien14]